MTTREAVFWLLKKSLISDDTEQAGDSITEISAGNHKVSITENDLFGHEKAQDKNNIYLNYPAVDLSTVDWSSVYDLMKMHTIEFLPHEWLKANQLPDSSIYASWMKSYMVQKVRWIQLLKAQGELLALLTEHDIPCVIIKGTAAAMAYAHPSCRAIGDVDFLVKRCDYQKAAEVIRSKDYEELSEIDHHIAFRKRGICFELHRRLPVVDDANEDVLTLVESGIDNREIANIGSDAFPVLPSYLNGLVLIFHINQHLRAGLGLRQIIDWMMYVDKADQETMDKLMLLLRQTGMERLANTVTAACQKYFGLRKGINDSKEQYPCDAFVEYIINQGNFGRADENPYAKTFLRLQNPVEVFKFCDQYGIKHWPAAKQFIFLRPLACIYGAGRVVVKAISKKLKLGDLWNQYRKSREYRKLIASLGLKLDRTIKSNHD